MAARKDKGNGKKSSARVRSLSPKALAAGKAKNVRGGAFIFKLVAVKTVSWAHDDEKPSK